MDIIKDSEFRQWLGDLKNRIRQSQLRAAIKVNSELLQLYWDLGRDIVVRQMDAVWGSGFFKKLSKELMKEFPEMQGFSVTNLKYCRYFYLFYSQSNQNFSQFGDELHSYADGCLQVSKDDVDTVCPQAGDELYVLFSIPWGHQKLLIDKCKSVHEALFYVQKTIKNGWSRAVLMNFINMDLYHTQGKSINNFDKLLPDKFKSALPSIEEIERELRS